MSASAKPGPIAEQTATAGSDKRRIATSILIAAWAAASFMAATSLMAPHWFALPRPETGDAVLRARIRAARLPEESGGWFVVHFLYAGCRCSQRILDHLVGRRRLPAAAERVVLVGPRPDFETRARAADFRVDVIGPTELVSRFGVQSAPMFVVADARDDIRYVGGYSERKQGPRIRDVEIIEGLLRGEASTQLPLFGCAVSRSLQAVLDPFGLKYRDQE